MSSSRVTWLSVLSSVFERDTRGSDPAGMVSQRRGHQALTLALGRVGQQEPAVLRLPELGGAEHRGRPGVRAGAADPPGGVDDLDDVFTGRRAARRGRRRAWHREVAAGLIKPDGELGIDGAQQ